MSPWQVLKRVSIENLWNVFALSVQHPLFLWPTAKATRQTMAISYDHYGKKHHQNGPANAFRHGLWNYLIAKRCTKYSRDNVKCSNWAKKITDWHEHAFPNRELARKMDFHNNALGRRFFLEKSSLTIEQAIEEFKKLTQESIFVDTSTDLESLKNKFVHITNETKR